MPRDRVVAASHQSERIHAERTGLFASARRLDLRHPKKRNGKEVRKETWQDLAWSYYDTIGEFAFACNWVGNLLSRVRLYPAKNGTEVKSGPAFDAVNALFGGHLGQAEMLRKLGIHLTCPGEGYIIAETKVDGTEAWNIVANTKITEILTGPGEKRRWKINGEEKTDLVVMRIWRPHPVNPNAATSPTRAVLPILAELDAFGRRVAANIDSRLVGAGLLFIPNEVSFASMPVADEDGAGYTRAGVDGFQDMLIEVASLAIENQNSSEAKVPIVVQIPGDQIGNVKYQTFWTELDAESINLRAEAIRRIALGMDMPPEALTGTAEMNHWNAWQLEEAAIKVHTEPLLNLITSALTEQWLRVYLEGMVSDSDLNLYTIEADTTELRLRPNRSKEAQELYDRGVLGLDAMLRENGFDPDDKMKGEELKNWFIRKVASGSTTPELVAEALRLLEVPVVGPHDDPTPEVTREARPDRSLLEHPVRELPEMEDPLAASGAAIDGEVLGAAEALVFRALERAGNRLKGRGIRPNGVPAMDVYQTVPLSAGDLDELLDDAWSCAERLGCQVPVEQVDGYTRTLMLSRKPHDRDLLRDYLTLTRGTS